MCFQVTVKGCVHITGGGIAGNVNRILKKTNPEMGVILDDLFAPCDLMKNIQKWGNVNDEEAYRTWNMGNGKKQIMYHITYRI